ncbi:hypothetical protein KY348_01080 [Candidatus Woesearchaeota archaeon]|nr:hypothetical protein [Candidatus Woesearchaeota archaeon]
MDLDKFNEHVEKNRQNLEFLLYDNSSLHKRFKKVLKNLLDDQEYRLSATVKIQRRKNRFLEISSLKLTFFSIFSGRIVYALYHEAGEMIYIAPFLAYIKHLREKYSFNTTKSRKQKININISESSPSDVFGDLLASTYSPLTPKEQLDLSNRKNIERPLSRKEYGFVNTQAFILIQYSTRKETNYLYGPELKNFYDQVLELQEGFDIKQRKKFQLKMYDVLQNQIKDVMQEITNLFIKQDTDALKEKKVSDIFNLERLIEGLKT